MDGVQVLLDVEAIKTLKASYFRFVDTKRWDDLVALFTPDARLEVGGASDRSFNRADEFVAWVATAFEGARTVHHGHMPEIRFENAARATGIWALHDIIDQPHIEPLRRAGLLDRDSTGPMLRFQGYGHYHESYVKRQGGWLISQMRLSRVRVDRL